MPHTGPKSLRVVIHVILTATYKEGSVDIDVALYRSGHQSTERVNSLPQGHSW